MEASIHTNSLASPVLPTFPANYQRNKDRMALPYLNRTVFVSIDDIVTLEGEGNYTFICTRDRKRYLVSKTLKEFEKTLDATQFLRIHKSYMVNLAYVRSSLFTKERYVRLADGREVIVSRRRMRDISEQLGQYFQRLTN
jgi:two-component system, LytTR family, response regulator